MKIFLTGATGHSGRWFIQRLIDEKFDGALVCLVHKGRDLSHLENSGLNYSVLWGDIQDHALLLAGMEDADIVLHIAGIQKSREIMRAAKQSKIKWVILVHTTGRYSKFKSASAEYIAIEDEILKERNSNLSNTALSVENITIVRPTMIYGSVRDVNMHKLVIYLSKHKFFPLFGKGKNLMQPVHARDLGNAYYDIITNREKTLNKEYNLSGKEPIEYRKIIITTSNLLGRKTVILGVPFQLSLFAAKVYNAVFGKRAIINVEQVLRMQEDKDFSYEAAANDFGYAPIDFETGIQEEIEGMKENGTI